ncbi:acyltransferase [Sphaerisporangium rubeum]|uniref:Peptidoglycan/LPS O-acetylase OafA/YrhL n=1 Tax=Sphaerisporangium rubeum TaxID=321317 RepID=A0A7X0IDF3_9ACTN|nr:peptidoglycan/LPS O-acetylase OafA/YrhL [Sphaerisporangium rubeum]
MPSGGETGRVTAGRLAWLDALRGLGAMAVFGEHMIPWVVPSVRSYQFSLGIYGVLVFFLVSGYIIPTSLRRHDDPGAFWIGRLSRLYPLYLAVCALVLAVAPWVPPRPTVVADPSAVPAHATMLLDVLGVGGLADTMWTLSYEMVFYLLVTALYVVPSRAGRSYRAPAVPLALGAVAAGLLLAGPPLSGTWLPWVAGAVFAAGLACLVAGRYTVAAAGALGLTALGLLVLSSRVPWFGLAVVAVMFAGTAIRRWEDGEGTLWPVAATAALVVLAPVTAVQVGWWWVRPDVWILTIALAAATFAGGMALRGRRLPRALVWLGAVSYSVYLLHHPLLKYFVELTGDLRAAPLHIQLTMAALFTTAVLLAATVTHRLVERPGQALGRRLIARRRATRPAPSEPATETA